MLSSLEYVFYTNNPPDDWPSSDRLSLLEFLADALGIEYRRCMGRGFQAQAIQQALHQHFNTPSTHGPG